MDTWIDPRDLAMDRLGWTTPKVRGETGLGFRKAEDRTTPAPLRGRPPGSSTQSTPSRRKDGGDAGHPVPDFPRPGTWFQCSAANFPLFADQLRAFPHPACSLTSVPETHVRTSTIVGRRPLVGLRRRPPAALRAEALPPTPDDHHRRDG